MIIIAEQVIFEGIAVNKRFYNPDSMWGIFNIRTSDTIKYGKKIDSISDDSDKESIVTVVGNMQELVLGAKYKFIAESEFNSKYKSWQYKPSVVTPLAPKNKEETVLFLQSVLTEKQAQALISVYPDIVNDVMNGKDNVDVSKLKGIGEKTWIKIKDKIIDNFVLVDLITLLMPHGITATAIANMLKEESNPSLLKQKIEDNPYFLTNIKGFGFAKTDKIAIQINSELKCSRRRTVAFLKHYLTTCAENDGNTYVDLKNVRNEAEIAIPECVEKLDELIVEQSVESKFLKIVDGKIGLLYYYRIENEIYNKLKNISQTKFNFNINDDAVNAGILRTESEQGFEFSEEQKEIIQKAFENNVLLFTGGAGCGKTTISRAILNIYKEAGCSIATCSLSAKAARRITEATGHKASTIHRLLSFKDGKFEFNESNPLPYDVIFHDESSMTNAVLLNDLLRAIKSGARIIMCGDSNQLPAIGAGCPFADLIRMKNQFTSFELKTVHRQAAHSGILIDANKIKNGEFPVDSPAVKIVSGEDKDMLYAFRNDRDMMQQLAVKRFLSIAEKDGVDNAVLIVPRKTNCPNSTEELNKIIQDNLFAKSVPFIKYGKSVFKKGARVIQIENNYEKDTMNGEIGYIHDVDDRVPEDAECMVVKYDDEKYVGYTKKELGQIVLGYCLTAHRTQGSEWWNVVTVIDNTHTILLSRELLYTAITRAKKRCLLIAEPAAFKKSITFKSADRNTWLSIVR